MHNLHLLTSPCSFPANLVSIHRPTQRSDQRSTLSKQSQRACQNQCKVIFRNVKQTSLCLSLSLCLSVSVSLSLSLGKWPKIYQSSVSVAPAPLSLSLSLYIYHIPNRIASQFICVLTALFGGRLLACLVCASPSNQRNGPKTK